MVDIFWISNYELRITLFYFWLFPFSFCHSERSEESVLKLMVDGWWFKVNVSRFTFHVSRLMVDIFQITNYELRITPFYFWLFTFSFCHSERSEESVLKLIVDSWWLMVDGSRLTFHDSRFTIHGWYLLNFKLRITNYAFLLFTFPFFSFCHSERSEESVLKLIVDGSRLTIHVSRFTFHVSRFTFHVSWLMVVIFRISNYELRITLFYFWLFPFSFCHSERSEESVLKLIVDGMRLTFNV